MYWRLPAVLPSDTLSIFDWWDGMCETLPLMYTIARRILGAPATSCDAEHCFSSLKWGRDERWQDTKERMHRAAFLLHINGLVQQTHIDKFCFALCRFV